VIFPNAISEKTQIDAYNKNKNTNTAVDFFTINMSFRRTMRSRWGTTA